MSDSDSNEDPQKFFARQLLEINESLKALPAIKAEIVEAKKHLAMIQGWMDGQEEVSASQARRLDGINSTLETIGRRLYEYGERSTAALTMAVDMTTQLNGVTELSKSAYDIVVEIKKQVSLGGEDEANKNRAATQ